MDSNTFFTFLSFTLAIFLEAAPFLLVGSLLASLFEEFAEDELLARWLPKGTLSGIFAGIGAGMVLPTCECGVVPIVRKLLNRGVPAPTALAYMLAAPVVNPVVMLSTWVAFQGDWQILVGRVIMVVVPALALGWIVQAIPSKELLRPGTQKLSHSCCGGHHHRAKTRMGRVLSVLQHTAGEFIDMGQYLLLGAVVTALFKTFMPTDWAYALGDNLFLAVAIMMLLAIILSVCSEADAFVAASFKTFPAAAQLSFIGIGPMVDIKLILMFFAVFHRRLAIVLIILPTALVYFLGVAFGLFWL